MTPDDRTTGPVTFGQLSLLRSVETIAPEDSHVANLPDAWELPGRPDRREVTAAWHRLVAAHDAMRTTFEEHDGTWSQTVREPLPAPQDELPDVLVADVDQDSAQEVAEELATEVLDLRTGPLHRAVIVCDATGPRFLAVSVHHAVADSAAMTVLTEDFRTLLSGADLPAPPQPLDLARREQARSPHPNNLFQLQAWSRLEEADRVGHDDSHRQRVELYSERAGAVIDDLATRVRASPQAVVLGSLGLAVARLVDRERLTVGLMTANRWLPEDDRLVASMNQLVPHTLTMDPGRGLTDYFRAVYVDGMAALAHGTFDVDLLRRQAEEAGHPHPDPFHFDCHFNFLVGTPRPDDDDPIRTRIITRERNLVVLPRLNLNAWVSEDGVKLHMMASEQYLAGRDLAEVLAGVEAAIVSAAADPDAPCGDVDLTPLRSTVPIVIPATGAL